MYPLSLHVFPAQCLLEARVENLDGLQVAESNHETISIGRKGVNGYPVDHVAVFGALQLTKVSVLFGDLVAS